MTDLYYCLENGEEATCFRLSIDPKRIKCLIHGWQDKTHFGIESPNKVCEVCGKGYWCMDNIRKVCSMDCAGEYAKNG
jgi:hypothetical protein